MPEGVRPLVTVVTPSYNYARYLGQCLLSVRAQRYRPLEHLVVDGGSSDGSREVLAPFLGSYDLQATFEPDGGQADALAKGFARARGEVLCWLNADDFWLHDRVVEEAVERLGQGADWVTGSGRFVDGKGNLGRRWPVRAAWVEPELRYYDTVLQPATFWRRSAHRPLRTDLHYAFDWQLWLDVRRGGARLAVVEAEWAGYRMHETNKTGADPALRRAEVAAVLGGELGPGSLQARWARAVARGYQAAERRRLPALKAAVGAANLALYHLSRRRLFSC